MYYFYYRHNFYYIHTHIKTHLCINCKQSFALQRNHHVSFRSFTKHLTGHFYSILYSTEPITDLFHNILHSYILKKYFNHRRGYLIAPQNSLTG